MSTLSGTHIKRFGNDKTLSINYNNPVIPAVVAHTAHCESAKFKTSDPLSILIRFRNSLLGDA